MKSNIIFLLLISTFLQAQHWHEDFYDKELIYENSELFQTTPQQQAELENYYEMENKIIIEENNIEVVQNPNDEDSLMQEYFTEEDIQFILSDNKPTNNNRRPFQEVMTLKKNKSRNNQNNLVVTRNEVEDIIDTYLFDLE